MATHTSREAVADACVQMLDTGFFRALCEPVRVEILRQLILKGRSDVNTIAAQMPQDRSVIARHLQLMERAGLLHTQTEGRHTFYEIDGPAIVSRMSGLARTLESLVPICCPRPEAEG
ncbi:MAG: winged helix-turn-helix transcriptional regulator [Burkholderiales bacterium]|nr:winged helix-turn-helix transcriptional regulator [Burkholderiales bacterium]